MTSVDEAEVSLVLVVVTGATLEVVGAPLEVYIGGAGAEDVVAPPVYCGGV